MGVESTELHYYTYSTEQNKIPKMNYGAISVCVLFFATFLFSRQTKILRENFDWHIVSSTLDTSMFT